MAKKPVAQVATVPLDRAWLASHPLIGVAHDTDKNRRGTVLVVGGSRLSAGALRLTGEAAFRAGAGKVQLATPECLAIPLGMAVPEAGIIALAEGEKGEPARSSAEQLGNAMERCDCLVLGPGMGDSEAAGTLLDAALATLKRGQALVIDAAAIRACSERHAALRKARVPCVITPHPGELAALLGADDAPSPDEQAAMLTSAVKATGQLVLAKGAITLLAAPGEPTLCFAGGGPGLATGGSGDVLAGIIGALLARGQPPVSAAAWGVWLHGEAGRRLAEQQGPLGFLARELPPLIPSLMRGFA